jgi:hypothetical protein
MVTVVALGAFAAAAYYVMTVDERARALQRLVIAIRWLRDYGRRDLAPFWTSLRERTPAVRVTPGVAAVNAVVFVGLVFSAGPLGDPATLQRWGASFGPETTNAGWWPTRVGDGSFTVDSLRSSSTQPRCSSSASCSSGCSAPFRSRRRT